MLRCVGRHAQGAHTCVRVRARVWRLVWRRPRDGMVGVHAVARILPELPHVRCGAGGELRGLRWGEVCGLLVARGSWGSAAVSSRRRCAEG